MSDQEQTTHLEKTYDDITIAQFDRDILLSPEFPHNKDLLNLIIKGYDLSPEDVGEDIQEQLNIEYGHSDSAFLAFSREGKVVGSFSILDIN